MKLFLPAMLLSMSLPSAWGQLTTDQKVIDFQTLSSLLAKQYAPYVWKRDTLKVDLLNIKPWLDQVQSSKSDLEFYEILERYVGSLNDLHTEYFVPSTFLATIPLTFDVYDGKVLIDTIDRRSLSSLRYPFELGDELVSIDGQKADDFLDYVSALSAYGNDKSTRRWAATYLGARDQTVVPHAAEIGDRASVAVRRKSGAVETYSMPWTKTGRALTNNGPVVTPKSSNSNEASVVDIPVEPQPASVSYAAVEQFDAAPSYLRPLLRLQRKVNPRKNVRGYGLAAPVFRLPASFVQHRNSFYFSGVFQAEGKRIGYIRIGDFQPTAFQDLDVPFSVFSREINYLQTNSDGLIVDVMSNPGGFGCFGEDLLSLLIPYQFKVAGTGLRPTISDVNNFADAVDQSTFFGDEQWVIDLLSAYAAEVETAFSEKRGMTGPLPLCTLSFDRPPAANAYTKPIVLLTDELTTSTGDIFAAEFQDAKRGPVFGWRTAGGGGSLAQFPVGFYSEGMMSVSQVMTYRPSAIATTEFPTTNVIENVGVRPDIPVDYMTKDNLVNNGSDFVGRFTQAILAEIRKNN